VHLKENQVLKYLNCGSTHTEACFAAIPTGVMKRLASLTTRIDKSESIRMDELYPMHAKALQTANLVTNIFATLGKVLDNQQTYPTINDKEVKKDNQDTRTVQFCLQMSKWWNNPVHAILKELQNKHGLTWL
jgi:ABC-type oligopeptide transport system substrate-binding subunit